MGSDSSKPLVWGRAGLWHGLQGEILLHTPWKPWWALEGLDVLGGSSQIPFSVSTMCPQGRVQLWQAKRKRHF